MYNTYAAWHVHAYNVSDEKVMNLDNLERNLSKQKRSHTKVNSYCTNQERRSCISFPSPPLPLSLYRYVARNNSKFVSFIHCAHWKRENTPCMRAHAVRRAPGRVTYLQLHVYMYANAAAATHTPGAHLDRHVTNSDMKRKKECCHTWPFICFI